MNVTIKNIAKMAGVTPAAVSKALNGHSDISESTKKKIFEISRQLGYTPNEIARSLVKKSSNTIGLLIPDILSPVYTEIFKGIDSEAKKSGYNLFLCDTNRDIEVEKLYVRTFMEKRVNGIIMAPVSGNIKHVLEITRRSVPIVFIGGKVNDTMDNYVTNDNLYGARIATEYLLGLGHRKIYMLADTDTTKTKHDRIESYKATMEEAGAEPVVFISENNRSDSTKESGYQLASQIFSSYKLPTAIFACNDLVALGVMEAAAEKGLRIPGDISLVGYDDIMFVSLPNIMLTTVSQPKYKIGTLAVNLLLQAMDEEKNDINHRIIIKPELVIRNTCRPV